MSVGLLIITHNRIGIELLHSATVMMEVCPLNALALQVNQDCDPDEILEQARQMIRTLDQGKGILVMTDIYGSTPSNIANRLPDNNTITVVSGINLPMLIRVLNYPSLSLSDLTNKALSGGRDGILLCSQEHTREHDKKRN
ncbi:MAG: PTS fructose transporter subunit IIA [Gammaproteobacteria bacterium]|nr:PTS fructose transporter subunit IIA [Gammaproteobacteria bacterium]